MNLCKPVIQPAQVKIADIQRQLFVQISIECVVKLIKTILVL